MIASGSRTEEVKACIDGGGDGRSFEADVVSAARTVTFLRTELERVAPGTAAAELYVAFIEALELVYRLSRSG
jgi:hypothetical protein